jgi:hypothetical protein
MDLMAQAEPGAPVCEFVNWKKMEIVRLFREYN